MYPKIIRNRQLAFTGTEVKEFIAAKGICNSLNALATTRTNRKVERVKRSLVQELKCDGMSECLTVYGVLIIQ